MKIYRQHCSESEKVSCAGALGGAKNEQKIIELDFKNLVTPGD